MDKGSKIGVVSGLSPGFGGVPRLLEKLSDTHDLLCPRKSQTFFKIRILNRIVWLIIWIFEIMRFKGDRVLIVHHNSIPILIQMLVLIRFKSLAYYAIDNSYFCVKSYNFRDKKACLECLGDTDGLPALKFHCSPFPLKKGRLSVWFERKLLLRYVAGGEVYTLSRSSAELFSRHFSESGDGSEVRAVRILNFSTRELEVELRERNALSVAGLSRSGKKSGCRPDLVSQKRVVFHGSANDAKGWEYCLELAELLLEISFVFPFKAPGDRVKTSELSNCLFIEMTWESGLRDAVQCADLVMCPSLWTYTPEAALLKSLIWTDRVFYVDVPGSFASDIPTSVGLRGTGVADLDSKAIRDLLRKDDDAFQGKGSRCAGLEFVEQFVSHFNKSVELL